MNQPLMRSISYSDFSYLPLPSTISIGKHLPLSTKSDGFLLHKPEPVPVYIDPCHFSCQTDWSSLYENISKLVPTFNFFIEKFQWKGTWYDDQMIEEVHVAIKVFSQADGSLLVELQRRQGDSILFYNRYRTFKSCLTGKPFAPFKFQCFKMEEKIVHKDTIDNLFKMSQSPFVDVAVEGLKGLLWLILQKETLKVVQTEYSKHALSLHQQDQTYTRLYDLFLERTKLNKKE